VVIYAYNHHVRLLSPEPLVVDKPQSTRVEEPTLLCNHVVFVFAWNLLFRFPRLNVYQALGKLSPDARLSCLNSLCLKPTPRTFRI
jgi:hypothetical protein